LARLGVHVKYGRPQPPRGREGGDHVA
jgi:hypothetical protein